MDDQANTPPTETPAADFPPQVNRRRHRLMPRGLSWLLPFQAPAVIGYSPMRKNAYRGGRHLNQRQRRKRLRQISGGRL